MTREEYIRSLVDQNIPGDKMFELVKQWEIDNPQTEEVEEFINDLDIPKNKVWAMPAGDTRISLMESYPIVMDFVRDRGWRFTGRSHIMAFDIQREV